MYLEENLDDYNSSVVSDFDSTCAKELVNSLPAYKQQEALYEE